MWGEKDEIKDQEHKTVRTTGGDSTVLIIVNHS